MNRPERRTPAVSLIAHFAGGCAAVLALASAAANGRSSFHASSAVEAVAAGSTGVQVAGAATTIAVATLPAVRKNLIAIGLGLAVATLLVVASDALAVGYVAAVCAGAALGCLANHAGASAYQDGSVALWIGAISGVALVRPLSRPLDYGEISNRFELVHVALVVLAIVAVVALIGGRSNAVDTRAEDRALDAGARVERARGVSVGMVLLFIALAIDWWFTIDVIEASSGRTEVWWWGYAPVVAIIVAGLVVRGVGGALLVAAGAWSVFRTGEITWLPTNPAWLLVAVATVAAGALAGMRIRRPIFGLAVLMACAMTYLIVGSTLRATYSFTTIFIAPAAFAFTVAGLLAIRRPSAPITSIAITGPIAWVIAPRLVYVLFAGSGDQQSTVQSALGPQTLAAAAEVALPIAAAIAACAIAADSLLRHTNASTP